MALNRYKRSACFTSALFFGLYSEGAPTWPLMSGRTWAQRAWAGEESRGRANWGALIKWRHTKWQGASGQQLSIHPVSEEFLHLNESMHCQRGSRATKGGSVWLRGLGHTDQKLGWKVLPLWPTLAHSERNPLWRLRPP